MSETLTLSAEVRERAGKGASRDLRRQGRVPAVIYGNKEEPQGVHVEELLDAGDFAISGEATLQLGRVEAIVPVGVLDP